MRTHPSAATRGVAELAITTFGALAVRTAYAHWGATPIEKAAVMPGDDAIPYPRLMSTRAITIDSPPEDVWPWLVQIGHGRGGLYSYDALENLVGCDIHSTDRVVPGYQDLEPGDLIRLGPDGYPCYRVASMEAPHVLVLVAADPETLQVPALPILGHEAVGATWQWTLTSMDEGWRTRLVARQRITFPKRQSTAWHLVEPANFLMERRMLRGMKARAERPVPAAVA